MATKRHGWNPEAVNEPGSPEVAIIDRDLTAPPVSPSDGDLYIPAATATGAWVGQENKIAGWDDVGSVWKFQSPPNGFRVWVTDESRKIICNTGAWHKAEDYINHDDLAGYIPGKLNFYFDADQLLSPNNADWKINALAPLSADSNNAALSVRLCDDTAEEGVGFTIAIPVGAATMKIKTRSRAETAPAGARTVGLKLYNRGLPDNVAPQAWSAGNVLADLDIPANEYFQYDEEALTLATLGVTAGEVTQFELTRVAPTAGTNLTGDLALLWVGVEFN